MHLKRVKTSQFSCHQIGMFCGGIKYVKGWRRLAFLVVRKISSTNNVHGVTELTVICAVKPQRTKPTFQSRGPIPIGRKCKFQTLQGTKLPSIALRQNFGILRNVSNLPAGFNQINFGISTSVETNYILIQYGCSTRPIEEKIDFLRPKGSKR